MWQGKEVEELGKTYGTLRLQCSEQSLNFEQGPFHGLCIVDISSLMQWEVIKRHFREVTWLLLLFGRIALAALWRMSGRVRLEAKNIM